MKIDIPTPSQVRAMIKIEVHGRLGAIRQENVIIRRKIRGLEEEIKILNDTKKMSKLQLN